MNQQVQKTPQYVQVDPLPTLKNGSVDMLAVQMNPNHMATINTLGSMMAASKNMVPQHFQGQQSDCCAIIMQAMRWNMDPFSVAQQAFIVKGSMGYSSQLINAVITSSTAVEGGFEYEYSDQAGWDNLAGHVTLEEHTGKTGQVSQQPKSTGDRATLEKGLWVKCGCKRTGDKKITWGERVYMGDITTRNSPLWVTQPKQQLAYLCVKYWSRLYTPQVTMGVYTKDEIPEQGFESAKDVTPEKEAGDKPESSLRRPDLEAETHQGETIDGETGPAIDDTTADIDDGGAGEHEATEIQLMTLVQVIELLTAAATMDEVNEVMETVVKQNQFAKGTEEHDQIKAKFRARKRYFSVKNKATKAKPVADDDIEIPPPEHDQT